MVHRTMGFPHKSKPKSAYRVIWVETNNLKNNVIIWQEEKNVRTA